MEEALKQFIREYLADNLEIEQEVFTEHNGYDYESKRMETTIRLDGEVLNTNSVYL